VRTCDHQDNITKLRLVACLCPSSELPVHTSAIWCPIQDQTLVIGAIVHDDPASAWLDLHALPPMHYFPCRA
jgi:hypothetical protein